MFSTKFLSTHSIKAPNTPQILLYVDQVQLKGKSTRWSWFYVSTTLLLTSSDHSTWEHLLEALIFWQLELNIKTRDVFQITNNLTFQWRNYPGSRMHSVVCLTKIACWISPGGVELHNYVQLFAAGNRVSCSTAAAIKKQTRWICCEKGLFHRRRTEFSKENYTWAEPELQENLQKKNDSGDYDAKQTSCLLGTRSRATFAI